MSKLFDLTEDEYFGSVRPDIPVTEAQPKGKAMSIDEHVNGGPKKKAVDHNIRTRSLYEAAGYTVFRVDQNRTLWDGRVIKLDFLGLFDWMAIHADPEIADIGIQVCGKSRMGAHETEMCSRNETSFNKRAKVDNLRAWLESGHLAHICGWDKVGARWQSTIRDVTMERVERAEARRKK